MAKPAHTHRHKFIHRVTSIAGPPPVTVSEKADWKYGGGGLDIEIDLPIDPTSPRISGTVTPSGVSLTAWITDSNGVDGPFLGVDPNPSDTSGIWKVAMTGHWLTDAGDYTFNIQGTYTVKGGKDGGFVTILKVSASFTI
jgi:hypothetical protein